LVAEEVPAWFWDVIETNRPSIARLVAWLESATEDEIVSYQLAYELAAEAIIGYWEGPSVEGVQFSEDDTEDMCRWVVSQGRQAWEDARSGRVRLDVVALRYLTRDAGPLSEDAGPLPEQDGWTPGNPAYSVFFERFHDSLDERMSAVWEAAGHI
jgi:hypothetical protein